MPRSPKISRKRAAGYSHHGRLELGNGPTHRPLQCLVFITPFLLIYQIGAMLHPWQPSQQTPDHVIAFVLLLKFFAAFGAFGSYMPLATVVSILLAWHLARKDPWDFDPWLYLRMGAESVLWAIPVFVIGLTVQQRLSAPPNPPPAPAPHAVQPANPGLPLAAAVNHAPASHTAERLTPPPPANYLLKDRLPWPSKVVISIGAGVYEELIFRLIAITLLHLILVDVFEMKIAHAIPIIILVSATAFAAYHYLGDTPLTPSYFLFLMAFGIYSAGIFLFRGFGIAVGMHAVYDLIVVGAAFYRGV